MSENLWGNYCAMMSSKGKLSGKGGWIQDEFFPSPRITAKLLYISWFSFKKNKKKAIKIFKLTLVALVALISVFYNLFGALNNDIFIVLLINNNNNKKPNFVLYCV